MNGTVEVSGPRRRGVGDQNRENERNEGAIQPEPDDASDDSDVEGGDKSLSRAYKKTCPTGKFFLNPCICLFSSIYSCLSSFWLHRRKGGVISLCFKRGRHIHSENQKRALIHRTTSTIEQWRNKLDIRIGRLAGAVFLIFLVVSHSRQRRGWIRNSDTSIFIRRFDFSNIDDLGGWLFPSRPFPKVSRLDEMEEADHTDPDYGDINYHSISRLSQRYSAESSLPWRRAIDSHDNSKYDAEMSRRLKKMDQHLTRYLQDDDSVFDDNCRRVNWWKRYKPNCNVFHEFDLSRDYDSDVILHPDDRDYETKRVSHGFFRDVYTLETTKRRKAELEFRIIMKVLRYRTEWKQSTLENVRKDALVMELLSKSPRIVDIYGHCAGSVTVEYIPNEVEEFIIPGEGMAKPEDLNDSKDVDVKNDFSATEKLTTALQMAESIADLHGFEGGVIVHDDIQLCQWLRKEDGSLKLGDFNRAEVMLYDETSGENCKYKNGKGFGNYRAPEEFDATYLDEKIDVFSFGNNIYGLLTGLWVFYDTDDDGVVHKKLIDGELAYVDKRYKTRSYAEGKLVELMEKCWIYEPEERIDIFSAVKFLREAVAENARLERAKQK